MAAGGFIHLINSGATTLDATGAMTDADGKPTMKTHWELTNELRDAAIAAGVDYVMDIFTPHYGTDGDASVAAGYDIRHAAIGPGTLSSHGYERTHVDGLANTYRLLEAYLFQKKVR